MTRKYEVTSYGVKLPTLSDNLSLSLYLESFISLLVGMLVLFRPSIISVEANSVVQMVIPAISMLVAFGIQIFNAWRNTVVKSKLIMSSSHAGRDVMLMTSAEYKSAFSPQIEV